MDEDIDGVGLRVEDVVTYLQESGKAFPRKASGQERIPDFREAKPLEISDVDGYELRDAMEDEA